MAKKPTKITTKERRDQEKASRSLVQKLMVREAISPFCAKSGLVQFTISTDKLAYHLLNLNCLVL
jgi:hypothetical protein